MLKRWLLLASAIFLIPGSAFAASNDMFRGKTITYIVSTTAGGGYDTYGRMIARYMPKYLPGSRMIVRNVPGAGNIIAIFAAVVVGGFMIYRHLLFRKHKSAFLAAELGTSPLPLGDPLNDEAPLAGTPLVTSKKARSLRRKRLF